MALLAGVHAAHAAVVGVSVARGALRRVIHGHSQEARALELKHNRRQSVGQHNASSSGVWIMLFKLKLITGSPRRERGIGRVQPQAVHMPRFMQWLEQRMLLLMLILAFDLNVLVLSSCFAGIRIIICIPPEVILCAQTKNVYALSNGPGSN